MLKHCSNSSLDLRSGDKRCLSEEHMAGHVVAVDSLCSRLSASLRCLEQEQSLSTDQPASLRSHRVPRHRLAHRQQGDTSSTEPIRVYASCLRSDIEYRTVRISKTTTASQVIMGLLSKYKMKHVDKNMFFLAMEVTIEEGNTTMIRITEDNILSDILRCNPWRESKLRLCSEPGVCIRVHDTVLMQDSVYKSICISGATTVREVIGIVLACSDSNIHQDTLCLVQHKFNTRRVLDSEEGVLEVVNSRGEEQMHHKLVVEYKRDQSSKITKESKDTYMTQKTPRIERSRHSRKASLDSFDSGFSGLSL